IEEERITKILGVPTIFKGLLQHPDLQRYDLSSLQECYLGGAPTSTPLIEEVEEKLGCRAIVGYGLTETCPVITLARPKPKFKSLPALRRTYQAKTGLPLVGVRMRVVDQDGNDVPRDEKTLGEIIVRGNQVMREYFKDEEATQAALRGGWLHTGDMAVVDQEGYITILDRKKDIIISGGENISSVEIENVIRSHPAVDEVAVIGVPDDTWGEVPKALIVLNPGQKATEEELIQHVRQSLASFKVPKSAEFRSSLPRGGTGKILKRQLKAPYWEGYAKNVN
ncbi:MAG: AMP-binding protein, partial [Anaerolineales bacterium]|nr:AMP-binding protein [Anaerolineales bacterium]